MIKFMNWWPFGSSAEASVIQAPELALWWHYHDPSRGVIVIENRSSAVINKIDLKFLPAEKDFPERIVPLNDVPSSHTITLHLNGLWPEVQEMAVSIDRINVIWNGVISQSFILQENYIYQEY